MKVKKCFKPKSLFVHRLEVEQVLSKISMTDLPQTNGGKEIANNTTFDTPD